MSVRRIQLNNDESYHVIVRGVGDSLIFRNKDDYYRAIFSIYEFNTIDPIEIRRRRKIRKENGGQASADKLVDILAFCFMPNHIHLWLKQLRDNGITKFMQKFGTGYASYFNTKYDRKGHLFQGKFKAVYVEDNNQFQNLFVYIHTNPISLVEPNWKENGIKKPKKAIQFIEKYKWSSYSDYLGNDNFPSVTTRDFVLEIMGGKEGCRKFINDWVKYKGEISNLREIILE